MAPYSYTDHLDRWFTWMTPEIRLRADSALGEAAASLLDHAASVGDHVSAAGLRFPSAPTLNAELDKSAPGAGSKLDVGVYPTVEPVFMGAFGLFVVGVGVWTGTPGQVFLGVALAAFALVQYVLHRPDGKTNAARTASFGERRFGPDAMVSEAVVKNTFLMGEKALHVHSFTLSTDGIAVKSIFWDAISNATCTVDDYGVERVEIFGREGHRVAVLKGPSSVLEVFDASCLLRIIADKALRTRADAHKQS